MDSKVVVDMVF